MAEFPKPAGLRWRDPKGWLVGRPRPGQLPGESLDLAGLWTRSRGWVCPSPPCLWASHSTWLLVRTLLVASDRNPSQSKNGQLLAYGTDQARRAGLRLAVPGDKLSVTAEVLGQFHWDDLGPMPNPDPITVAREQKALIGQAWITGLILLGEPQGEKNVQERRGNAPSRVSGCNAHLLQVNEIHRPGCLALSRGA